ncbi:MAG TPA: ATP-binding protein, partial [Nannocystaceae bacterium]|nr:ATP-binding protein [Nannocystaceae bacterium]
TDQRPNEDDHDMLQQRLRSVLAQLGAAQQELRERDSQLAAAHREIERGRQRYRDLFVHAPIAYVVTDRDCNIVEINAVATALLGPPSEELVGRSLSGWVSAADRPVFKHWIECAREGVGNPPVVEVHMRKAGGDEWFRCRAHVALERDAEAGVVAQRFILFDATTAERAELAERLELEARRMDEFLAMLAHELRNPLAPIRAAAELWRHHADMLTPEQSQWSVEVVSRQADQLAHLVDDLLDVSRVSHGKIRLQRSTVELRELAEQARDALRAAMQLHKVSFHLDSEHVYVDGDPTRLRQVVVNLVDNALKYTPKGRGIEVRVRGEGNDAVIEVQDQGVGLRPEELESIFGMFEQNQSSLGQSQGGLGLGLTLVRKLVELHGGTVQARSEGIGKGSTFVVRLRRIDAPDPTPLPSDSQMMALGRRSVLVVDDNVDAAEMLGALLEAQGHQPSIAYDGAGAIDLFERVRPDVVLLDLGLPGLDGLEVARELRARAEDVLLVALTGYGEESMRARTRESGFDHHLLKPVDFEALRTLLLSRRKSAPHE